MTKTEIIVALDAIRDAAIQAHGEIDSVLIQLSKLELKIEDDLRRETEAAKGNDR